MFWLHFWGVGGLDATRIMHLITFWTSYAKMTFMLRRDRNTYSVLCILSHTVSLFLTHYWHTTPYLSNTHHPSVAADRANNGVCVSIMYDLWNFPALHSFDNALLYLYVILSLHQVNSECEAAFGCSLGIENQQEGQKWVKCSPLCSTAVRYSLSFIIFTLWPELHYIWPAASLSPLRFP